MIRVCVQNSDEIETLTTAQFIEGIRLEQVIGFHFEDFGPGKHSVDDLKNGLNGYELCEVNFFMNVRKGDMYWMRNGFYKHQSGLWERQCRWYRPKEVTVEDIVKELEDT